MTGFDTRLGALKMEDRKMQDQQYFVVENAVPNK